MHAFTVPDNKGAGDDINSQVLADILDTPKHKSSSGRTPSPCSPNSRPTCSSPSSLLSTDSESPSTPTRRRRKPKSRSGSRPSSSPLLGRAANKLASSPLLSRANRIGIGKNRGGAGGGAGGGTEEGVGVGVGVGGGSGGSCSSSPRKSPKKRASMPPPASVDPEESGDENLVTFNAEVHHQHDSNSPAALGGDFVEGMDNPAFVASDSGYALNTKLTMEMTNDETSF